jgi:integrase
MSVASSKRVPTYCKHKPTGQAKVVLSGKTFYLGRHGTAASEQAYDRLIQEWLAAGRRLPSREALSVSALILAFLHHAERYYRKPDGRPTSETSNLKQAFRPLKELYGDTEANSFGPQELKTVRESMIIRGWLRKPINRNVERIRRMYRWGGEQGIVAAECYHRLLCVSGLKIGRSDAKEGEPVRPVPVAFIEAVKPLVWSPIRAMIDLQLLTAMRPGEACIVRGCDLETSGRVWIYRPQRHKTEHHGHTREIYLGPQAQEIIKPFLKPDLQAFLFSPAEARAEHFRELRVNRQTKVQPSQVCRKKKQPKKLPGDFYTVASYRRAIARACAKAGVPSWHPHQLRHNAATNLRKQHGIELARIILGHSTAFTTEIYAEQDRAAAVEVIAKIG